MARQKAERFYVTRFIVRGSGDFPVDMLRYDTCHPASESDSHLMQSSYGVPNLDMRDVRIVMRSVSPNGPTVARWDSFTWHVVPHHMLSTDDQYWVERGV